MADEAFAAFGGLDVLINNVGDVAREQMSWRDITEESIDHVLDVDIKGTMFCIHEFGARMLDQGHGSIVNIGSTVIVRGSARAPQYAAAKYGILGATKSYAQAFAPTVRVNVFAPGFIETEATLSREDWKTGRAREAAQPDPDGPHPGPGRAGRHRAVPRERRRVAHDRRLHGCRRRLQHGRRMTAAPEAGTVTGAALVQRIPNVGLHVTDVEQSLAFYRDLLGLHVVVDSGWLDDPDLLALTATPGGRIRIVNLAAQGDGGATITVVGVTGIERRPATGGEFHDVGTMHLAVETADLDGALATLQAAGVAAVALPGRVSGGGPGDARVAFVRDPDGFFVELVQKLGG